MINKEELSVLAQSEIKGVNPNTLPDLLSVQINGSTAVERLDSFLSQVKNPYCAKVGKTPVKISFVGEKTLEQHLKSHFIALKTNDFAG